MTDERRGDPHLVEILRPTIERMVQGTGRQIEAALQPLIARIEDLERQVAELRGAPSNTTSDREDDDPPL